MKVILYNVKPTDQEVKEALVQAVADAKGVSIVKVDFKMILSWVQDQRKNMVFSNGYFFN